MSEPFLPRHWSGWLMAAACSVLLTVALRQCVWLARELFFSGPIYWGELLPGWH